MSIEDGHDVLDLDAIDAALGAGAGRGPALQSAQPHRTRLHRSGSWAALAAVVDRHGARVIADEVHAPLVYDGRRHVPYATVSEAAADHAVTVTSASKAFNLAGLKCAQVVATNHADAARWRRLRVFEVAGPTPLGIAATTAAYRDGGSWWRDLVAYLEATARSSSSAWPRSCRRSRAADPRRPSSRGWTAPRSASTIPRASFSTTRELH